ncbi:MAG: FAD-dependent oxidoreductase [Candidatus Omnitrophica bacterium]|nr:FAD-dependent oxidoreductase [Candidatus Omnitrophota bacterium]
MRIKTDFLVVGSGAGGATVAMELAKRGKKVLIVDRGGIANGKDIGTLKSAVFGFYDKCALRTSTEGIIVYRALMAGGTTVVSCGNGVRVLEEELKLRGVSLENEFLETERELGIAPLRSDRIGPGSRLIMDAANRLGLEMLPMPKFIDAAKCVSCGNCILGCKTGAKWSALDFVKKARRSGAKFIRKIDVRSVAVRGGRAIGVVAKSPKGTVRIYADKVILAAGGIGTPVILKRSGIANAGNKLFADLFNVTYGVSKQKEVDQWKEVSMSTLSTKFMKDKGFIISPFIDVPLVLRWVTSKRKQLQGFRYKNLLGIMAKTRDDDIGKVTEREIFEKTLSAGDHERLREGQSVARNILLEAGVEEDDIFFTKPRAAHPGGSAAIGDVVGSNLETDIKGLYICDASVLPVSPGAPPIVTIVALAKRLAGAIS